MSAKYKALYLTSLFPHPKVHSGAFTVQRIKAMQKNGVEVMVACPVTKTPPKNVFLNPKKLIKWIQTVNSIPNCAEIEGIHVNYIKRYQMPHPIFGWYSYLFLYWQMQSELNRLISEIKPEIIISSWLPSCVIACMLGKRFGIPIIVIAEGSDINYLPSEYRGWPFARNILNKYAAVLVFVSDILRGQAIKRGLINKKMTVINNGVDAVIFSLKEKKKATNHKKILFVGNLAPVKGIQFLPETLSLLISKYKQPVQLTIVGDGPLKKKIFKEFQELGLGSLVEFVDPMPQKNLAIYYQQADLLCLPSLSEGFGCVILEAMACGTPVVASRVVGVGEIIDSISGLLVEPGNPQRLAEALEIALEREWNPISIRERVIEKLTWDHIGKEFINLIQEIICK